MIAYVQRVYRAIGFVILTGLVVSGISLFLFAEIAEEIAEQDTIVHIDTALTNELYQRSIASPTTVHIFELISLFGSQILYVVGVVVGMMFLRRRLWFYCLMWTIALLGGNLLNNLIKLYFARPRPLFDDPVAFEPTFSFPSGHAMMSFIVYGLSAYLLCIDFKNRYARIFIVFGAVLAIVLIGISRLYLGVHYLSDVLGGYAAGAVWLATCITAIRIYRYRIGRIAQPAKIEINSNFT